MNCNLEKNKKHCNCTYEPCPRKGACCECIQYHISLNELPACFFSDEDEKTYDRSVTKFIRSKQHQCGRLSSSGLETVSQLLFCSFLSFLRRQESSKINTLWIPAFQPEADPSYGGREDDNKKQLRHSLLTRGSIKNQIPDLLQRRISERLE